MAVPDAFAPGRGRPAHVIAVCNLKGGTGKSTVSVNLACALTGLHPRVLLVDNDEQGSAATWAGHGRLPIACVPMPLARAENITAWIRELTALRREHDLVLVDFPAGLAPALAVTLLMASAILIPCAASELEIAATRRMMRHVGIARAERAHDPPAVVIVPTRVAEAHQSVELFYHRLAALGEELGPPVGLDPAYDRALLQGTWVGGYEPDAAAHREILALAALVEARLAPREPAPWPPLRATAPPPRPMAVGESRGRGTAALAVSRAEEEEPAPFARPVPALRRPIPGIEPKVLYLDDPAAAAGSARSGGRSWLRWALRLVGRR